MHKFHYEQLKKIIEESNNSKIMECYKQHLINKVIQNASLSVGYLEMGDINLLSTKQYSCIIHTILTSLIILDLMKTDFKFTEKQRMIAISTIILNNQEVVALECYKQINITPKKRYRLFKSILTKVYKINALIKNKLIKFESQEIKIIIYTLINYELPIDVIGTMLYSRYKDEILQLDPELTGQLYAQIIAYQLSKNQ